MWRASAHLCVGGSPVWKVGLAAALSPVCTLMRQVLLAVDRIGGTVGGEPEKAATGGKQEACERWEAGKECTEGTRRMSESKTGRKK